MDVCVRYHELALKKKNRPWFIRHLMDNLRHATRDLPERKVWLGAEYIGLHVEDDSLWPIVQKRVQDTMGIAKYFRARLMPLDLDSVEILIKDYLQDKEFGSFRISAHRANKNFPVKSDEINRRLGKSVQGMTGARVDLKAPELEISIDVLHKEILVYFGTHPGYGGLPVGVSGHVAVMMSGGIDSPIAAWHMMKRGCRVSLVHFHSYPLADMSTINKAAELADIIARFQGHTNLYLVPLAEVQKHIIVNTPSEFRVILYRRFMLRIAEEIAKQRGAKGLVTGDSLGQVSSQTLENIAVVDEVASLPVFRPLIGQNKQEIVDLARRIETFQVSIQPDQDCCTLFIPRKVTTHADPDVVHRIEEKLPVDEMVAEAVKGVEKREFDFPEMSTQN